MLRIDSRLSITLVSDWVDASLVAVHDTTTLAHLMPSGGVHPIAYLPSSCSTDPSASSSASSAGTASGPGTIPRPGGPTDPDTAKELSEVRSEEHTSELQSLMRIPYDVL